nr:hypothetical protein [Moorena producens]
MKRARCPFHKTFFPCSLFPVPCSLYPSILVSHLILKRYIFAD